MDSTSGWSETAHQQGQKAGPHLHGGVHRSQEVLDFCAEHGITAEIEKISADQVNEAFDRMVDEDVTFRFVIDNSTLPDPQGV